MINRGKSMGETVLSTKAGGRSATSVVRDLCYIPDPIQHTWLPFPDFFSLTEFVQKNGTVGIDP